MVMKEPKSAMKHPNENQWEIYEMVMKGPRSLMKYPNEKYKKW